MWVVHYNDDIKQAWQGQQTILDQKSSLEPLELEPLGSASYDQLKYCLLLCELLLVTSPSGYVRIDNWTDR